MTKIRSKLDDVSTELSVTNTALEASKAEVLALEASTSESEAAQAQGATDVHSEEEYFEGESDSDRNLHSIEPDSDVRKPILKECLNSSRVIKQLKQELIKKEENLQTTQKMKTIVLQRLKEKNLVIESLQQELKDKENESE